MNNILEKIETKIAISSYKNECKTKQKNTNLFSKIAVAALALTIISGGAVIANKTIIRYDEKTGKPIVVAGEEVPEELKGQEVVIAIPADLSLQKTDYFPELISILNKYHDESEVKRICSAAQKPGYGNEDVLTAEGGKELYNLVYNIIKNTDVTLDDEKRLKNILQNLDNTSINWDTLDADVLNTLFPINEEDLYWDKHKYIETTARVLEAQRNQTFLDILYLYYEKEMLDELVDTIGKNPEDITSKEKLVELMIDLLKNDNVVHEEKVILEYRIREAIRNFGSSKAEEWEEKVNNIYK